MSSERTAPPPVTTPPASAAPTAGSGALIRWLWHGYLKRHLPLIVVAMLLMMVEGAMLGALSYMMKPMFDNVLVTGDPSAITWVALGIFGVFSFRALAGFGQKVLMALVGERTAARLQHDLVAHMVTLDSSFFQHNSPGTLIERTRGDTTVAANVWSSVFAAAGRDFVGLLALLAVALSIDVKLTLIAMVGVPLVAVPIAILQKLVRRSAQNARSEAAGLSTRLDEIFHGVNTIKLTGGEARETRRFGEVLKRFVGATVRSLAGRAAIPALIDVVAGLGFMGVLYYGGNQIMAGERTVGEFMAFFTAMALIFDPLRRLGNVSGTWNAALASFERLYEVFQQKPSILSPASPQQLPMPAERADIELRNVEFGYGEHPVLRGTSFVAEAGKTTALVGASGAGKSTVFNLLTRLCDAQSGQVMIGGKEVNQLDLATLRGLFSVVSQEALLFDETLRDNILLGANASEAALNRALQAAHVADFLPRLSDGLETPAGPRGSALSGGQKQRVAIARAVLRNSPVLLLDEATSALDAKSESVVQKALEQLSAGRTTLVIAHRLSTIRTADKIVVMDQGQVVEQGSHEELLALGGTYASLHALQFRSDGPTAEARALSRQPAPRGAMPATPPSLFARLKSLLHR
jgi:ATP-binding cassette, subfamily B, bacterial MsbA